MSWRRITALLTAALVLGGPAGAGAAVCLKAGRLLFRATGCKRHEHAAAPGAPGVPGAKGPRGTSAWPTLRNAAGQNLGTVKPDAGVLLLASPVDGRALDLEVATSGPVGGVTIFHEGAGCAGPRFITSHGKTHLTRPVQSYNGTGYYAGDPIDDVPRMYLSHEYGTSDCNTGDFIAPSGLCCSDQPDQVTAGPAVTFDLTALLGLGRFSVVP